MIQAVCDNEQKPTDTKDEQRKKEAIKRYRGSNLDRPQNSDTVGAGPTILRGTNAEREKAVRLSSYTSSENNTSAPRGANEPYPKTSVPQKPAASTFILDAYTHESD